MSRKFTELFNEQINNLNDPSKQYSQYISPLFVKGMKALGFTKEFEKGYGIWLEDSNGNKYLDLISGSGVFFLGRNNPEIGDVLIEIIQSKFSNLSQTDTPKYAALLAKELIKLSPEKISKVFFCNSGSEAVETAIKFAVASSGKGEIIYSRDAFHGLTLGSLSVNGIDYFTEKFQKFIKKNTMVPFGEIKVLDEVLRKKEAAAFIIEPIQGYGINTSESNYFTEAQRLCKKYNTLFILDEVMTGLGRTGKFFALEHYSLEPDMIIVSKTLSGGFIPVGAVLMSDDIYKSVFNSSTNSNIHFTTFGQNTLAMAAGLATVLLIKEKNYCSRAAELGAIITQTLNEFKQKYSYFSKVRGKGLLIGLELKAPDGFLKNLDWNITHAINQSLFILNIVMKLFSDHNILSLPARRNKDVIRLLPPVIISEQEIKQFCVALDKVLSEVSNENFTSFQTSKKLIKNIIS